MKYKHDIFLSYNNADKDWTEQLASSIESDNDGRRLKVFFDRWDIIPGSSIPNELEDALSTSRFVGLIITQEFLKSKWTDFERTMAIYRDPNASERLIIPILRENCRVPLSIARLNYIDFTDDYIYNKSLNVLISLLRDKPMPRYTNLSQEQIVEREDYENFNKLINVFRRPAFEIPCILELYLKELCGAIDDIQAAIRTGATYSRTGNLLLQVPTIYDFKTEKFVTVLKEIPKLLVEVKKHTIELIEFFERFYPKNDETTFLPARALYDMLTGKIKTQSDLINNIKYTLSKMDLIDLKRNEILVILNSLIVTPINIFEEIELSSKEVNLKRYGLTEQISSLLDRNNIKL